MKWGNFVKMVVFELLAHFDTVLSCPITFTSHTYAENYYSL